MFCQPLAEVTMDGAFLSALAAIGGSAVGALASFATTWLSLHSQKQAHRVAQALARRESLYSEFIDEASLLFTDALAHELEDTSKLVRLYALVSKLRLFAPQDVLALADEVTRRIVTTYVNPEKEFQITIRQEQPDRDILRRFSEACRHDLEV
jgi:hypothetical protein